MYIEYVNKAFQKVLSIYNASSCSTCESFHLLHFILVDAENFFS